MKYDSMMKDAILSGWGIVFLMVIGLILDLVFHH